MRLLEVLLMRQFTLQPQWNVLFFACFDMTELHRALKLNVIPERTFIPQVCLVEPKVIVGQQALEPRVNFHVIHVIDRVYVAATVVNGAF